MQYIHKKHSPVLIYDDDKWWPFCDDHFTDIFAKRLCHEYGYVNGLAVVGSSFGNFSDVDGQYFNLNTTPTTICPNDFMSAERCSHYRRECKSGNYASVVCSEIDFKNEDGEQILVVYILIVCVNNLHLFFFAFMNQFTLYLVYLCQCYFFAKGTFIMAWSTVNNTAFHNVNVHH